MLKSLTLKNFRQHADRTFEFTDGLNVIRGANEAGKSGLLEAIQYAMFGVKFCREGISDMVTWGQLEATLSVLLIFEIEGVTYTIYRNKAGAELRYIGGHVTGQSEVGLFVARLLGVPLSAVSKLMIATQKDIRGTIDGGDTDAAKLIETLANLKVLDDLMDIIRDELSTGADVASQARLQDAKAALAALEATEEGVDTSEITARRGEITGSLPRIDAQLAEIATQLTPAQEKFSEMTRVKQKFDMWQTKQGVLQKQNAAIAADRTQALEAIKPAPSADALGAAEAIVENAKNEKEISTAHAATVILTNKVYANVWDDSLASFEKAYRACTSSSQAARETLSNCRAEIRLLESQIVTGSACGYCAKDIGSLPEVVEKNATLTSSIETFKVQAATAQALTAETAAELPVYTAIIASDAEVLKFATANPKFVRLLDTQVPRNLEWIGPVVGDGSVSVESATSTLSALRKDLQAHHGAMGQWQTFDKLAKANEVEIANHATTKPTEPVPEAEYSEAANAINGFNNKSFLLGEQAKKLNAELVELNTQIAAAEFAAQSQAQRKLTCQTTIDTAEKEIRELAFNNTLLKRVREVRPLVANHLWSKVLSSISHYFSQMRGAPSVVTKSDSGFRIDGHGLKGMSGSTLDALGVAVRLALTKTFTPHVSMLVVDEPFAAMDESRTLASLGFIAGMGFKQILLVTHEEASTANADNLITL